MTAGTIPDRCVCTWMFHIVPGVPTVQDVAGIVAQLPTGARLAAWQYENGQHYDLSAVINPDWHPS